WCSRRTPRTSTATSSGAIPCRSSPTCPRCSRASTPSTRSRGPGSAWWLAMTPRWPPASIRWSRGLSRSRRRLAALAVDLHRDGDAGEHDDHDDEHVHVLGDVGHGLAEEIARPAHGGDPPDAAHDVVGEEAAVIHYAAPPGPRVESAGEGDETGDLSGSSPHLPRATVVR